MKSFIIIMTNNVISTQGYHNFLNSKELHNKKLSVHVFDAILPHEVSNKLIEYNIRWDYPWNGTVYDPITNLKKPSYHTKTPNKRIACALSHYTLWLKCIELNEPILILEHDSVFIKTLTPDLFDTSYGILGINSPFNATKKANMFDYMVKNSEHEIHELGYWDNDISMPQGLAGNSSYIINPGGAKRMINLVKNYGLWPNDAIMCKQLLGNTIGVTKTYYTQVNNIGSTTSS